MDFKNIYMYALGGVITVGFFVILFYLVKQGDLETETGIAIGALIGAFSMVVSYFFGSSKGSADKNEMLKK
jgi:uncharacterized protein (UPF0333 family)